MGFYRLLFALSLTGLLVFSCTEETKKPEPKTNVTGVITGSSSIYFEDACVYDYNAQAYRVIKANEFASGQILSSIPIYGAATAKTVAMAKDLVLNACDLMRNNSAQKNDIIYIKIQRIAGVQYLYRYERFTELGEKQFETSGQLYTEGNYAYFPLINTPFHVIPTSSQLGQEYRHVISIVAQIGSTQSAPVSVSLTTKVSATNVDFAVANGSSLAGFSLPSRWSHYVVSTTTPGIYLPNDNFRLIRLESTNGSSENSAVIVRLIFKDPPRIKMEQLVFEEIPLKIDEFRATRSVIPERGHKFYIKKVELNSQTHFMHKFFLGTKAPSAGGDVGVLLTPSSSTVFEAEIPAGTIFNIGVSMNLQNNPGYSAAISASKPLLFPFRSVCHVIKNVDMSFDDIFSKTSGNLPAVCDLNTSNKVLITSPTAHLAIDTYYNYFSYAPYRPALNELGHFFGIAYVKFSFDACIKLQKSNISGSGTQLVNVGGGEDTCGSNEWTPISFEKTFAIWDSSHAGVLSSVPGLSDLITKLNGGIREIKNDIIFNNVKLRQGSTDRAHIY